MTFQAANPTMDSHPSITGAGRTASELLEDSGNGRQIIKQELSLHLLSDSPFSEQQKLRHVLDWVNSFLSCSAEVQHELCGPDSLMLAKEEREKSAVCKHSSSAKSHRPLSCAAGNEVFGGRDGGESDCYLCAHKSPFSDDPCCPFSLVSERDECREAYFTSNQRLPDLSNKNTAPGLIKDSSSGWSNMHHKRSKIAGARVNNDASERQMELSEVKVEKAAVRLGERELEVNEDQNSSSVFVLHANDGISNSKPEEPHRQMKKSSNFCLKIPPALSVYEQYQLCVDQLHDLRVRQIGCFESKGDRGSEEMAAPVEAPALPTHPENIKHLNKKVPAAEIGKKKSSDVINKKQDRCKYSRDRATLIEQRETEDRDNVVVKETPAVSGAECSGNNSKHGGRVKGAAGGLTSADDVAAVQDRAALIHNQGCSDLFSKRIRCNPDIKPGQSRVKGQEKTGGGRGRSLRLGQKSREPTSKELLQRPSGVKYTKRHSAEEKGEPTSACGDTHKCQPPTQTHNPPHSDLRATSPATCVWHCDSKYDPAGVTVLCRWLCLPDELWLAILSLLPLRDLCRVLQVCSRLHKLATDRTLWRDLRFENCTLTERWLLCVSRRRPRSLCLYSCSGPSLSSGILQMFFTLCRKTLEELKVTSCAGPGLHGDQMLALIGQLCDRVTSVDVSWSGATDTGVKALSDCCSGLRLISVVLNGCHITDDPLMKLVMRHKESLCRLEMFGCQFLTPSCLQRVYEMCPSLEHLNIGQVPKVDAHSLSVMTSQLKCLISLNLTGLQAVTDDIVDSLLQNCVKLQSLTFSSCPGVTDLTLHSISKYTPYIRFLDVSGCKTVTDAGVRSLALGCGRLQQLDLSSTSAGNRGVTLLANYCSGHLHTVKLSFCHVTRESILKLCRRCTRLKVLHLYGCPHLPTETEIREAAAAVKVYPSS